MTTQASRSWCAASARSASTTPTRTTTIAPSVVQAGTTVTCGNGTTYYAACTAGDTDKSLLLTVAAKTGGTFSVDAFREVT